MGYGGSGQKTVNIDSGPDNQGQNLGEGEGGKWSKDSSY